MWQTKYWKTPGDNNANQQHYNNNEVESPHLENITLQHFFCRFFALDWFSFLLWEAGSFMCAESLPQKPNKNNGGAFKFEKNVNAMGKLGDFCLR